jgi:hypothetical protein
VRRSNVQAARTAFTTEHVWPRAARARRYTVFKLAPGAYFKYSSGGTPVLLFALGYGTEGKRDVGETYAFVLGDRAALPVAAALGLIGIRSDHLLARCM